MELLILGLVNCLAQNDTLQKTENFHCALKLSYNSSLIYPGLRAGIEIPVRVLDKTKIKKSGTQKKLDKILYVSGNISWYHHPSYNDNIYATIETTIRKKIKSGFFTELSGGLGYSRTFLGATTYTVDDNGNVSIVSLTGYNYLLLILSGGIGYDFLKEYNWTVSIFSKLSMLTMVPYNSTFYLRPTIELGILFVPKKILLFKPKIKSIVY